MTTSEDIKRAFLEDARKVTTPKGRGELVSQWAIQLNVSKATLYRWLADSGIAPTRISTGGRKPRHTISDEVMEKILGLIHKTKRKTGKATLCYEDAIRGAEDLRWIKPGSLTVPQLVYWARKNGLLRRDILAKAPHLDLSSDHPNQCHQLDWSICLQWDFGDRGRPMKFLSWTQQLEKNKIVEVAKRRQYTIWRGLIVDHYSGAFFLRYFLVPGESAKMTLDFLEEVWFAHTNRALIFHGLPDILLTDRGPGHTSSFVRNLCRAYEVKLQFHQPGAPNVKGSVEVHHNIVETRFESRLQLAPPTDIIELNRRADDFQVEWNSGRTFNRHGQPRFQMWQQNIAGHLYIPNSPQQFRDAARSEPQSRKVDANGIIHWKGKLYEIPAEFKRLTGKKIEVVVMPRRQPAVAVGFKEEWRLAYPIRHDKAGFRADAKPISKVHRVPIDRAESFRRSTDKTELPPARVHRMTEDEKRSVVRQYPLPTAVVRTGDPSGVIKYEPKEAIRLVIEAIPDMSFDLRAKLSDELRPRENITDAELDEIIVRYHGLIEPIQTGYSAG
ncbi:MAG: hypothetical protein P9M15_01785 [Candidatus Electryoneaceae bacterium]|nr:hypothetical protein [Candidatus Electryoneaceae bacterium]